MSKCVHCGVYILEDAEYCPLCRGGLEAPDEEDRLRLSERVNLFPDINAEMRRFSLLKRILLFIAIVGSGIAMYLDLLYGDDLNFGIITTLGLFYLLAVVCIVTNLNIGVIGKVVPVALLGLLYTILIDIVLGFMKWSLAFVFPGAIVLLDIVIIALMIVNNADFQSYMVFEIIMILLSLIPIILVLAGVVTVQIPGIIAFIFSVILFLGTLIIGGKTARSEMRRRFHL
ncbi:MAG: zinc ribbon domain-containing protein [Lachnospiraceae bacterium]|nr:zinc ribbon domain-containing protein [Lachnospiraceae bacterium]